MTLGRARWLLPGALAVAAWFLAQPASANGRMPGATEFGISAADPDHLIARATYGLVQSFDRGASWQWICEQAINVSGESDPPMALTPDGSLVLLPTAGSSLISRDRGCSWAEAPAPLREHKPIDLTVDPSDPAHLLVVTSTIDTIDDAGIVSYTNVLFETRDNAASWREAGRLRPDFKVETVELAAADPRRIYVSGTASESPLVGVIERSDDAGASWERTTLDLPATSGSLFISAIDPSDPDRLWLRVPAQGDRFGLFPASLLFSADKGASFVMVGATTMGMLGFALSPDGTRVAYGGPADGLFVGPADGSAAFEHVSALRVRCLRWNRDGLYACGTEPMDPFSVGRSTDQGASFEPIYALRETCPQQCPDGSSFAQHCEAAWRGVAQRIAADGASCSVPWARPSTPGADAGVQDAGVQDAGGARDAGTRKDAMIPDANEPAPPARGDDDRSGCSVVAVRSSTASPLAVWLSVCALFLVRAARRRLARRSVVSRAMTVVTAVAVTAAGCSDDASDAMQPSARDAGMFAPCSKEIPPFEDGLSALGEQGRVAVRLIEASRYPPRKYANEWVLALEGADGQALADAQVSRVETFMPVHGHYGRPPATVEALEQPGQLRAKVHFTMRGPWEVRIAANAPELGEDAIVLEVCVEE